MTVAFVGGTGVSTTGAAKGTTSTTVAYNNVSAGRMAVLSVGVKPNTGTITTPTGWTKVSEATGGTGTNAADTGQTKAATYYRLLDGTETGSVTVNATGGSVQGAMDVYSKTQAFWDLSQFVSASDATHGTNHSAASGTWGDYGVNAGDLLHVAHSGDTDDAATATSAPTIVQSGTTFGTVTGRSQVRNTSGNQGMTYTWSALATAASANTAAVTTGFTWSVSSCGPDLTTRVREYDDFNTLTDAFSSTLDTAKWTVSGSAATSGGALVLNIAGSTTVQSVGNYRLASNSVTVHTTDFPTTGSTYYAGMRVGSRGNGGGDFIGIYYHGDATITFELTGTTAVSIALDETAHQWIRIKHDGTNVLLQTSPDGTTWTTRRTVLAVDFPAWVSSTGVEVVFEGAEGDSWSIDDFNLAPTSEVHTTSGTAATTVTATATRAGTHTTTGTAAVTVSASATRSTTRTVARTASVSATASAAVTTTRTVARTASVTAAATATRATVRTTIGTAATTVAATAAGGAVKTTAGTASATLSASATVATARPISGTAGVSATATAARAGVHVTTGTASASASASAVAAGVRPAAGTAPVTTGASASVATARTTARTAPAVTSASATLSSVRDTTGTAGVFVVATTVIEGQEEHTTSGTAPLTVSATATRSTTRTTARTAPVAASATAVRSTTRITAGAGAVAVTATAVSEATEAHTTSGTAVVHPAAAAAVAGTHVVARVALVTTAATATRSTTRSTVGTAGVTVTATYSRTAVQSGHRRIVDSSTLRVLDQAGRPSRIVDRGRTRRRPD